MFFATWAGNRSSGWAIRGRSGAGLMGGRYGILKGVFLTIQGLSPCPAGCAITAEMFAGKNKKIRKNYGPKFLTFF